MSRRTDIYESYMYNILLFHNVVEDAQIVQEKRIDLLKIKRLYTGKDPWYS
jgi:hypothetical protein